MRRALVALSIGLVALGCNPTPKPGISTDPSGRATESAVTTAAPPSATTSTEAPAGEGGRVQIVTAAADTDALSLVRTKRLEAKADGRVLVVYVGATWCEPCKRFKEELHSGRLDARLSKVTLLAFDADRDLDRLGAAGYTFKFVPFVALPGPDGRPAEAQEATGKGGQAWRELLAKLDAWQATAKPPAP